MKDYTQIYYATFYDGDTSQQPLCEICFASGNHRNADDIHHIGGRRSGGSKLLDIPEKLMAVCRHHHDLCESQTISDESQIQDHLAFAELLGIELDAELANKSLHELTQMYKNGEYDPTRR